MTQASYLHPLYRPCRAMRDRCNNPNNHAYQRYGARGITVCEAWNTSFAAFLADMGEKPSSAHSLDRIDNNGNYEPGNCRWATARQQNNNTRANRIINIHGAEKTLAEWAAESGVAVRTIHARLKAGWADVPAIYTPVVRSRAGFVGIKGKKLADADRITVFGEPLDVACQKAGLNLSTVRNRIRRGWTPEQAVSHPPCHGKRPFKAHTEFGIALTVPPDRFAYSPREEKAA